MSSCFLTGRVSSARKVPKHSIVFGKSFSKNGILAGRSFPLLLLARSTDPLKLPGSCYRKRRAQYVIDFSPYSHYSNSTFVQQIKNWFSNRCRGVDNSKVGRGDLKLDLNTRRKLAPTQAYCSYAWDSGLREIVLACWEQQKASATFDDNEDPPEDADGLSTEACIPLAFKLKIVKEALLVTSFY